MKHIKKYNEGIQQSNEIPSAEEYLDKRLTELGIRHIDEVNDEIEVIMVEWTKLHVDAALLKASEEAKLNTRTNDWQERYIDKKSIINSYPLENIK